ncbi:hypothetical protein [Streptomyces sp. NRRL F-5123]|uniref:hypothetical protein n=1 Tax=Streptomyces sp. NRRL F-5123 TaxID=1463856 RepID=UPI0004E0D337|nr:hypothetical protein [Streptomyces sp. NRRL F-5123]
MPKPRNDKLRALLSEAELSGTALAHRVNRLAAAQGHTTRYDRTSVAHWVAGSQPRRDIAELVAQVLTARCRRLVTAEDTGLSAEPPGPGRILQERDPVTRLLGICRMEADAVRRVEIHQAPYRLVPVPSPRPAGAPRASYRTGWNGLPPQRAERASGDVIQTVADLSAQYGGAHARTMLAAYVADDIGPLLTGLVTSPGEHRAALRRASQAACLLGRMSADCRYEGLAQQYYSCSADLAETAGDQETRVIALRHMAVQAMALGHNEQAELRIRNAMQNADGLGSGAVRSFLSSGQAVINANAGRSEDALSDLRLAQEQHERMKGPPGLFTSYSRAALLYQQGRVLLTLGYPADAAKALERSLDSRPRGQVRARALTHAQLADALLGLGHVDAACRHWHGFLRLHPLVRSPLTLQTLTGLRTAFGPYRSIPKVARLMESSNSEVQCPGGGDHGV